jgi:hypothetical protein
MVYHVCLNLTRSMRYKMPVHSTLHVRYHGLDSSHSTIAHPTSRYATTASPLSLDYGSVSDACSMSLLIAYHADETRSGNVVRQAN